MDVNDLRVVVTVLSFVAFIGIVLWVVARRNAARFDAAAQLPFLEAAAQRPLQEAAAQRPMQEAGDAPAAATDGARP